MNRFFAAVKGSSAQNMLNVVPTTTGLY